MSVPSAIRSLRNSAMSTLTAHCQTYMAMTGYVPSYADTEKLKALMLHAQKLPLGLTYRRSSFHLLSWLWLRYRYLLLLKRLFYELFYLITVNSWQEQSITEKICRVPDVMTLSTVFPSDLARYPMVLKIAKPANTLVKPSAMTTMSVSLHGTHQTKAQDLQSQLNNIAISPG